MPASRNLLPVTWAFCALFTGAADLRGQAGEVTIQGRIEYWDSIDEVYRPVRHVFVEVEGDWWWRSDPETETGDDGRYRVTVPDPPGWWGDYDDVDIEVYAETQDLLQIYASMLDIYPYHVISREVDDVEDGRTVTIDVRIGGPSSTARETHYRSMAENANAFLVHQEMHDFIQGLWTAGMPSDAFDEKEVIVPAVSPWGVSYYNNYTGYINLVESDWTGTGGWADLPRGDAGHVAFNDFRETLRHEYSHALHDEISGWVIPLGLTSPSFHSLTIETDRFIALTEGFASFLPLATLGIRDHDVEWSPLPGSPYPPHREGLALAESRSHWAMEGEVAGLLWDVWDPQGMEPLRHPATVTVVDSVPVPPEIVEREFWVDGLSDGRFERIHRILNAYPGTWPTQTIAEFTDYYQDWFPDDLHWLKAAAFNRQITRDLPRERQAILLDPPTVSTLGRRATLRFTVQETDPEDRPHVRAILYHQPAGGSARFLELRGFRSGWEGDRNATTWEVTLPQVPRAGDLLWIEVTDDMLPSIYLLPLPEGRLLADIPVIPPDRFPEVRAADRARILPRVVAPPSRMEGPGAAARAGTMEPEEAALPPLESVRAMVELREAIENAKDDLRSYAEVEEAARAISEGLLKLSQVRGRPGAGPSAEGRDRIHALIQRQQALAQRAASHRAALESALKKTRFPPAHQFLQADLRRLVADLERRLEAVERDKELPDRLQALERAVVSLDPPR